MAPLKARLQPQRQRPGAALPRAPLQSQGLFWGDGTQAGYLSSSRSRPVRCPPRRDRLPNFPGRPRPFWSPGRASGRRHRFPLAKELVRRSRPRGKWPRGRAGRRPPLPPGFCGLCLGIPSRDLWLQQLEPLVYLAWRIEWLPFSLWVRGFLLSVGRGVCPSTSHRRGSLQTPSYTVPSSHGRVFQENEGNLLEHPEWGSHS